MKKAQKTAIKEISTTPAKQERKHGGGPPLGSVNGKTHGYHHAKGFLERGLSAIPPDSPLTPYIAELRDQISIDLGGKEQLSRMAMDLIDSYIATMLLVRGIDGYAFEMQSKGLSVIDRRSHRLRSLFADQRPGLIRLQLEIARTLGIERKTAKVDIVAELAALADRRNQASEETADE